MIILIFLDSLNVANENAVFIATHAKVNVACFFEERDLVFCQFGMQGLDSRPFWASRLCDNLITTYLAKDCKKNLLCQIRSDQASIRLHCIAGAPRSCMRTRPHPSPIQYNSMPYNTTQYNTMSYNVMRYNTGLSRLCEKAGHLNYCIVLYI
jgi:uncharacterized protein YlaI